MNPQFLDLNDAARHLGIPPDELLRRARRGDVPAQSRGDRWVFPKAEIDHWVERRIGEGSHDQLVHIERSVSGDPSLPNLLVGALVRPEAVVLELPSRTRASVLADLIAAAGKTGLVDDPEGLLEAVRQREEIIPTAFDGGFAFPHPRRPDPYLVAEDLVVIARTLRGIPFGSPDGRLTDLFFLLICRDDRAHLTTLARLTRMLADAAFRDTLRLAVDLDEFLAALTTREQALRAR